MRLILAAVALAVFVLILVHHGVKHRGIIVQWKDINNHETWAMMALGVAIGLLLGG